MKKPTTSRSKKIKESEKAKAEVEKMLKEGGLYNPLIEKYEIQPCL